MKDFLIGLLIFFSLCLCGLIWFQWVREGAARREMQASHDRIYSTLEQIQGLQTTLKRTEEEVKRLDALKNDLAGTLKSNRQALASLTRDLEHANAEVERHLKQIDAYKEALDRANKSISEQNENVKRQDEQMKKLAQERNEIVAKFNKVVGDFNDLAGKWNALQDQLAGTNTPPANPSR
jgi:chromosome segregation ATPase